MRGRWQRIFDRTLNRTGSRDRARLIADRRSSEIYMQSGTRETALLLHQQLVGRANTWNVRTAPRQKAIGWRDLDEILLDHQFWADQKTLVVGRMEPLMRHVFDEGIAFAKTIDLKKGILPRPGRRDAADDAEAEAAALAAIDAARLEDAAGQVFRTYIDDWWLGLQTTTQQRLRDAIIISSQDGTGTPGVIRAIAPLFGDARAKRIGVTETTRLFGRGAQALYQAAGVSHWVWHDVEDDRVCPICDELNGNVYPMSHPFDPAHPSCRCFAGPA